MKLRLLGKEKEHTFVAGFGKNWLPMPCDRIHWFAMAYDRIRWITVASVGIRWHATASNRTPLSHCPAPKMKLNTFTMPLAIMPTTEKMACVTV